MLYVYAINFTRKEKKIAKKNEQKSTPNINSNGDDNIKKKNRNEMK